MERAYTYYRDTTSICPKCLKRVPAKIIIKNNSVYISKFCNLHKDQFELLEEDAKYYLEREKYDKPGNLSKIETSINKGCPFDCGLCPSHDQHTCIGLIEITNKCDLNCINCYADSGKGIDLSLKQIEKMLDFYVDAEGGKAEILQISGGEPTQHPKIIEIISLARKKNIKYVMLNTNGIRIAEDENFAKELGKFKGGFEIYLQFDGFSDKVYETIRGRKLIDIKLKAIKNLKKYDVPITLVATIVKGLNDDELGKIIDFGMNTECIRGLNLQPFAFFGRKTLFDTKNRITLSGIISNIIKQTKGLIQEGDIIPLPCNVERNAVTYMLKQKNGIYLPLTRQKRIENYLSIIDNTFAFDIEGIVEKGKKMDSDTGCCSSLNFIKDVKRNFPAKLMFMTKSQKIKYINNNVFRISITSFVDYYNFDLKSIQKECVHIITPDLKRIPFSSYNMFYRK